eukprot:SAG11_NODE_14252_length_619_cov_2.476923_1_plen_43_part_10
MYVCVRPALSRGQLLGLFVLRAGCRPLGSPVKLFALHRGYTRV